MQLRNVNRRILRLTNSERVSREQEKDKEERKYLAQSPATRLQIPFLTPSKKRNLVPLAPSTNYMDSSSSSVRHLEEEEGERGRERERERGAEIDSSPFPPPKGKLESTKADKLPSSFCVQSKIKQI